jgi:short-subunit dehydrogenase
MPKSLQDQVVLITGASSGFGADAAKLFAKEGCIVILAARRMDRLTALSEQICAEGFRAYALPLDVGEQSQVDDAVQTLLENFERIDILFNNAGFGSLNWLEKLDTGRDLDAQVEINLTGLMRVTRAVLPSMLARRSGHIINMSSVAGYIAAPLYTVYAATKFGVRGFTDALRRELLPFGIKVSGVYPGPAITEFGKHADTGTVKVKKEFKVPRWINMTSEYVARRVVRVAKHPRRVVVLPWWFRPVIAFEVLFPGVVDWFVKIVIVDRFHKLEE